MTDMSPAEALYFAAVALPAAERSAYLDRACEGRAELRGVIERMLAAQDQVGDFLETAAAFASKVPAQTADFRPSAAPGLVIAGRYELVETIGQGGMGEVWVAKQIEPVKRRVALKLIKAGMDSKAVLQRFEQERQALALMDHPNIAKVLDGGITAERRPFFVMELVSGLPLTKFCDDAKLGVRERLELFVPICHAVQHAHQKGVVHRDLKPSNILVTIVDGRGVPKVIDFGVAKATSGRLTDESLSTQFGAVVGTLEYMSPEQAGFAGEDVDTRADIYSLGVILYELLTGLRPLDAQRLRKAALTEMVRIIREEEPSKPSTRISTDDSAPSLAALRHTEPKKLAAMLRGELDWVVMKCLEKQRDRRYESASSLARDVQRYLSDEPVEARPPSAGYLLRKFARRNRGLLAAAALVFLALTGGLAGTTWGLARAERAWQSEANRAEAEREAKDLAQRRAEQVEKANDILASVFRDLDPKKEAKGGPPLRAQLGDRLDEAARLLESESVGDPIAVARLQDRLGTSLNSLGRYDQAVSVLEKSLHTRERLLGPDHILTLRSANNLGDAYQSVGRTADAVKLLERTLQKLQTVVPAPDLMWAVMSNLAAAQVAAGKPELAEPLLKQVLAQRLTTLGPEHPVTLQAKGNLSALYGALKRFDESLRLEEEVLKVHRETLPAGHPDVLVNMHNAAVGYGEVGRHDKALELYTQALELELKNLGPDHPATWLTMRDMAVSRRALGRVDLAIPQMEQVLAKQRERLGPEHPETLRTLDKLSELYIDVGRLDDSLRSAEQALAGRRRKLGDEHPHTLLSMNSLAVSYWGFNRLDRSVPLFEELLPLQRRTLGAIHNDTLTTLANLAVNYRFAGRSTDAARLAEEYLSAYPKLAASNRLDAVWFLSFAAQIFDDVGQTARADEVARDAIEEHRKLLSAANPLLAEALAVRGQTLVKRGRFDEAERLLREATAIREKAEPDAWRTFHAKSLLGGALAGQKKYGAAEPLLLEGYRGLKQREATIPPVHRSRLAEAAQRLVRLYEAWGKPEQAAEWRKNLPAKPAAK